ncbi:unnamed protein product [Staurois parvus]|uniref:Uncharacterized protein n=1 Tax=Staurois parvus TaxID=386267 RepID=A0ABN9FGC8_9NEOB|nr:unnamed protein product [Staurois parvus]
MTAKMGCPLPDFTRIRPRNCKTFTTNKNHLYSVWV